MCPMKYDAVLIAGPTASGKSAAALALARAYRRRGDQCRLHAGLSRSAHPDGAARCGRTARQCRICSMAMSRAREAYSVGRYAADARRALAEARAMGKRSHLCRRHRALFHALDGRPGRDSRRSPPQSRAEARALAGARSASSDFMRAWRRAIRKRRRSFVPAIRNACCAPTKCSRRPAGLGRLAADTKCAGAGRPEACALRARSAAAGSARPHRRAV